MTINQLRSKLYKAAKFLGDVQAVKTGDPTKITKRVARRAAGKQTGRVLGKLFKWRHTCHVFIKTINIVIFCGITLKRVEDEPSTLFSCLWIIDFSLNKCELKTTRDYCRSPADLDSSWRFIPKQRFRPLIGKNHRFIDLWNAHGYCVPSRRSDSGVLSKLRDFVFLENSCCFFLIKHRWLI